MAIEKSTHNLCAGINNSEELNNGNLAIYCKENGNLTLLDPAGAIPNNSVNHEDLIMYASLTSRVRNKSLVLNKPEERAQEINFIKGVTNAVGGAPVGDTFLSTNWTNVGSLDSQIGDDLETFGMTAIDISFNGGFVPIITIDFVDIRGATLFEQGSCSPYGGFFHQPYPIFELTIKGYYGQPVKYYLMCQKFQTSFDPGTGNYKSRGEYIGYSYAFLSDVALGYIMAAAYMEDYGSESKLKNIYERYIKYYKSFSPPYNEGVNKFDPLAGDDDRPFTLFNYSRKIQELLTQGNSDSGAISEIQNSTELASIAELDKVQEIISDIKKELKKFEEEWGDNGGQSDNNLYTFGNSERGNQSTPASDKIKDIYTKYFGNIGTISVKVEAINTFLADSELKSPVTNKIEKADFSLLVGDGTPLYTLDLKLFVGKIQTKEDELVNALNQERQNFKNLANQKVKASIGFVPTIRSFFTVLLANTELFLDILKDVSNEAEIYHANSEETFNFKGEERQVRDCHWAWPTVYQQKTLGNKGQSNVEVYPGIIPQYANWPEVKFVEEFLKALQEMQKDLAGETDPEEPTVDIYDDVPGRDNYIAINAMESPIGAKDCNNGYFNVNGIEETFKSLGERFITLSNFTSANSNYLNYSIIGSARNYFDSWQFGGKDDSPILRDRAGIIVPTTVETGCADIIFEGFDSLNAGYMTPYFSVGAPRRPSKLLQKDGFTTVPTLNSQTVGGFLGFPFYPLQASEGQPLGFAGSVQASGGQNPFMTYEGAGAQIPISDELEGELVNGLDAAAIANTDVTNLTSTAENRIFYWDNGDSSVILNSPFTQKITTSPFGEKGKFIISEPVNYTKSIIYMWPDIENTQSREAQFNQIPQEIKDSYFIIVGAGVKNGEQNTLDELQQAFKNFYALEGNERKLEDGTVLQLNNDITTYKNVYIGVGEGGKALFPDESVRNINASSSLIGLISPAIFEGDNLSDTAYWTNKSRMIWGNDTFTSTYKATNYQTLNDAIIQIGGKSKIKNGLVQSTAIREWFNEYKQDVLDVAGTSTLRIINTTLNKQEDANTSDGGNLSLEAFRSELLDFSASFNNLGTSIGDFTYGTKAPTAGDMMKRQSDNWEFLGRIEAHNAYNSITNVPLLGQIINESSEVKDLLAKVIKNLNISEDNQFNLLGNGTNLETIYKYDEPLILNRVARENGGKVTLLPDIHQMKGNDLVRLRIFDRQSFGLSPFPTAQELIVSQYLENDPDLNRKNFGIKEDSTFLGKGSEINSYLNEYYGVEFKGEHKIGGDIEERITDPKKPERQGRIVSIIDRQINKTPLSSLQYGQTNRFFITGLALQEWGLTDVGRKPIDNAKDDLNSSFQNKFANNMISVMDKFLTVDIFPDFEFYYKFSEGFLKPKSDGGDYNWKYARTLYEFNNPSNKELKVDGLPFRGWHAGDLASTALVYNVELWRQLPYLNFTNFNGGFNKNKTTFGQIEYLPYSTSYGTTLMSPKKAQTLLKNASPTTYEINFDFDVNAALGGKCCEEYQDVSCVPQYDAQGNFLGVFVSGGPAGSGGLVGCGPSDPFDTPAARKTRYEALLEKNELFKRLVDEGKITESEGIEVAKISLEIDSGDLSQKTLGGTVNFSGGLNFEEYLRKTYDPSQEEINREFGETESGSILNLSNFNYFGGLSVQGTEVGTTNTISNNNIKPQQLFTVLNPEQRGVLGDDENGNANYLNAGASIVETPWWRHNFPATENGSNINKSYYSFFGGGVMNVVDDKSYSNIGLCELPLYMGLRNDLDSYELSSKFFPAGLTVTEGEGPFDFYNGPSNQGRKKQKTLLTNHNEDEIVLTRVIDDTSLDGNTLTESLENATTYNRTKAWKGALAYLFLANQFHKPWTGLYTNSLKTLGPQGILGSASINTAVPRQSVLLLGAVLWRMRESGLLESDKDRWNMSPEITNGLDPVCYPKLPNKLYEANSRKYYDTRNFLFIDDTDFGAATSNPIPSNYNGYPTNHGLRPPQLSIITPFNSDTKFSNGSNSAGIATALAFPRADEWPVPNTGMIYAYDFFKDKKVENPFKNQYKIFTPIFGNGAKRLLRLENEQIMFSSKEGDAVKVLDDIEQEFNDAVSNLDDYSDSAQGSINEDLGEFTQNYIEDQVEQFNAFASTGGLLESRLEGKLLLAGSDEGYTRFAAVSVPIGVEGAFRYWADLKNVGEYNNEPIKMSAAWAKENFGKGPTVPGIGDYTLDARNTFYRKEPLSSVETSTDAGTVSAANNLLAINGESSDIEITQLKNLNVSLPGLYAGKSSLPDYLAKNTVEIEIKTYQDLDRLRLKNEYVDSDGNVVKVDDVIAELPYPEEATTTTVQPNELIYNYVTDAGTYFYDTKKKLTKQILKQSNNFNLEQNVILNGTNVNLLATTDGKKPKTFKSIKGSVNIHTASPSDVKSWDIQKGQRLELIGGYKISPTNGIATQYNYGIKWSRYFSDSKTFLSSQDRSPKAQEVINKLYLLGISDDDIKTNLYHWVGEFNEQGLAYRVTGAQIGRRFLVVPTVKNETVDNTGGETEQSGTLSPQEALEVAKVEEVFKNIGYLRGYMPMGPEIWFMPTSVKQIFIKEFEDFVGDFNNFTDSDFDDILQKIDPLNFPNYEKPAPIEAGVFEKELIYPTMIDELGSLATSAPTILRLKDSRELNEYSRVVNIDGLQDNGLPNIPKQLTNWIDLHSYGIASKPIAFGETFTNTLIREQNTKPPLANKSPEPAEGQENQATQIGSRETVISKEAPTYDIWRRLFDTYYIISSSTPRTWSAEFPLKEIPGPLRAEFKIGETVNDGFYFYKPELFAFLKGFALELQSFAITEDYKNKIKSQFGDVTGEALGANLDDDLRLTIYKEMKSLYDKWISASPAGKTDDGGNNLFYNPIGPNRTLIDHFSFTNRINEDVGDKALVDLESVSTVLKNSKNSVFTTTSSVLSKSNFIFFPLPTYVDLSAGISKFSQDNLTEEYRKRSLIDMFRPLSNQEYFETTVLDNSGPHFLAQYVGGKSQVLELFNNQEKGCLSEQSPSSAKCSSAGDSFSLEDNTTDIGKQTETSRGVTGFKVRFGSETQSHFLGVSLDQAEHSNTAESFLSIDKISRANKDGGSGGFVAKGQSLYEIFLNRSYNCTVEGLGNAMIQPLQYFELENVPMFYGSYLIMDVKHSIRPHSMKTTFTGNRVPYAQVPIVEDIVSTFKLKPTQKGERKSLKSGKSSSSTSTKTITTTRAIDPSKDFPGSKLSAKLLNSLASVKVEESKTKDGFFGNEAFGHINYKRNKFAVSPGGGLPTGIAIHWTAGLKYKGLQSGIARCGGGCYIGYHYRIQNTGEIIQTGSLDLAANHAGCSSTDPKCFDLNGKYHAPATIGISYEGGVEGGWGKQAKDKEGNLIDAASSSAYIRTWEQWQTEELTVPFCPNGFAKRRKKGYYVCAKDGEEGNKLFLNSKGKGYGHGTPYKPKAQWESLVNAILLAKAKHPTIKFLTSHHWAKAGKVDVGDDFPWDKLIEYLKERGWNKEEAGADPYVVTAWYKGGKLVKESTLEDADYVITNAEVQEFIDNEKEDTSGDGIVGAEFKTDGNGTLISPKDWKSVANSTVYLYLQHQQGTTGAAEIYSLARGNGKYAKFGDTAKRKAALKGNWPSDLEKASDNSFGVAKSDVDKLLNSGDANNKKLAGAFEEVWKKRYYSVLQKVASIKDTGKVGTKTKNRTGTPYKDIYDICDKYGSTIPVDSLAAFCWIENAFETDTAEEKLVDGKWVANPYQTIFQLNTAYYGDCEKCKKVLPKLTKTNSSTKNTTTKRNYKDWQKTDTLFSLTVPIIAGSYGEFAKKSGINEDS